eukprot:evm.model.scf_1052.7 EVM.evm.TU.scf_1052.7   scf_1052:50927-51808(-)
MPCPGGLRLRGGAGLLPRGGLPPLATCFSRGSSPQLHCRRLHVMAARIAPPRGSEGSTPDSVDFAPGRVCAWVLCAVPLAGPALAEDAVNYDPSRGSEFVTTAAGFAYVALLAGYLFWILSRRAKKFTSEPLGGRRRAAEAAAEEQPPEEAPRRRLNRRMTPLDAAFGALVAGALSLGLLVFARKVDAIYGPMELPEDYTARNVAVTIRTIIRGMSYLATFVFGANAVGLAGLGVKLVIDPAAGDPEEDEGPGRDAPSLPKLSVTSSPGDVARAFDEVMDKGTMVSKPEEEED